MAVLSGFGFAVLRREPRNDSTMIPPRISHYPIDNLQIAALAAVLRNKMLNCIIRSLRKTIEKLGHGGNVIAETAAPSGSRREPKEGT